MNHKEALFMKKISRMLTMALVLGISIFSMSIAAYAGKQQPQAKKLAQEESKPKEYSFKSGNTAVNMGAAAKDILTALGKAEKESEVNSCACQGKLKTYSYKGFEVSTIQDKGTDIISSVYILDKTVSTPEGISIGSSKEDVLRIYGKDCKENKGVYIYSLGNSELNIFTTNNVVDGIEYLYIAK